MHVARPSPRTTPALDASPHTSVRAPAALRQLVQPADVEIGGERPWDIRVHDPGVYDRVLSAGSLGFGEAYMDGLWDALRLDETFARLLQANAEQSFGGLARLRLGLAALKSRLINRQSAARAFQVGERHYDIGNSVYQAMLDTTMSYSCGLWENADNLEDAQIAKLELICRKLDLRREDRLLDIGCGWGGLAEYASRTRGTRVVGDTVSRQQAALAGERCRDLPIDVRLEDYRDLEGGFHKIVSVGMFEHVGHKNYDTFFRIISRLLDDDGLLLIQTIGKRDAGAGVDPWIDRYIFPNSELPNAERVAHAFGPYFVLDDWHCFGQDYDRTLLAWWENFHRNWHRLEKEGYDRRFYRMWKYYLHSCAGFFRARKGQLWQIVLSKPKRRRIYRSVR